MSQRRKRREPLFQPGSYVAVHRVPLKEKHICCRVVEFLEKNVYRLCCLNGVISEIVPKKNLRAVTSARRIPLDNWRMTMRISLKVAQSDPQNIEECSCKAYEAEEVVDLTDLAQCSASPRKTGRVWIRNSLYILQDSDRRIIASRLARWQHYRCIAEAVSTALSTNPRTGAANTGTSRWIPIPLWILEVIIGFWCPV